MILRRKIRVFDEFAGKGISSLIKSNEVYK